MVLSVVSGAAQAGPLDRSGRPVDVIFEPGGYVELSLGHVRPSTSGVVAPASGGADVTSGDVTKDFARAETRRSSGPCPSPTGA